MKRLLLPIISILAVLALAGGAAFALTGGSTGDEDDESAGGDALGICVEGTVDCNDTPTGNDTDTSDEPAPGDDAAGGTCLEGTTDCNDTGWSPYPCEPTDASCEEHHVALVTEDLTARTGAEVTLVSAEYVKWPDASLGNPEPGMAYAQVITPGYKIILIAGGAQYEYHTDTADNFTLVE
jgi:hypothetical protein